jgi:hypothetical protein
MKSHKIYLVTFLLLIAATISNCTVQKRSYRNGYYVSWNKKTVPVSFIAKHVEEKSKKILKNETFKTIIISPAETPEAIFASVKKNVNSELKRLNIKPLKFPGDSCGDVITLRDGSDITVKVMEISSKVIKYKRCDNLGGPLIVVNIENVFMIKYANGTKEVFKRDEKKEVVQNGNSEIAVKKLPIKRINNPEALASFILLCFSFLIIPAPVSFIFGLVALGEFKKYPEKYKNKWMALIPVILGCIVLFLLLIAMLGLL